MKLKDFGNPGLNYFTNNIFIVELAEKKFYSNENFKEKVRNRNKILRNNYILKYYEKFLKRWMSKFILFKAKSNVTRQRFLPPHNNSVKENVTKIDTKFM